METMRGVDPMMTSIPVGGSALTFPDRSCIEIVRLLTVSLAGPSGRQEQHAGVAQLVEQPICNRQVAGSNPVASSI